MVRVRCHGKIHSLKLHHGKHGKKYVMSRKHGGGTKRVYIHKRGSIYIKK